jgi:hypothetical protein
MAIGRNDEPEVDRSANVSVISRAGIIGVVDPSAHPARVHAAADPAAAAAGSVALAAAAEPIADPAAACARPRHVGGACRSRIPLPRHRRSNDWRRNLKPNLGGRRHDLGGRISQVGGGCSAFGVSFTFSGAAGSGGGGGFSNTSNIFSCSFTAPAGSNPRPVMKA